MEVRLLGGEPLLHPEILKILLLSIKGGFKVLIFSNLNLPEQLIHSIFPCNLDSIRINCNLNNKDFYTAEEYVRLKRNIEYLKEQGHEIFIGYNVFDIKKQCDDVMDFAKECGIQHINLKVTNTTMGKELIVDTSSREYGKYFFNVVHKYKDTFSFHFSCGLDKSIFIEEELELFKVLGISMNFGCAGFAGEYDIDVDGSIYKCFPTRDIYRGKGLSIDTYNPKYTYIESFGVEKSSGVCSAHKTK